MEDSLDKADEFSFIGRQLGVMRHELPVKEGNWPRALMQNSTDTEARGVTLEVEIPTEIQELEDWCGHQCAL
jgi:hypothetical protein